METAPVLPRKKLPAAPLAVVMKPFRGGAHLFGARNMVFASAVIVFAVFDFLVAGLTGWGAVSFLLGVGMVYTLTAGIPMRTRLFRVLPMAAVLLAVALAAVPVPNSAPTGSPPFRITNCHDAHAVPAPCAQPCAPARVAKRPGDSALDACVSSPEPRGTLKDGAPPAARGGA